MAAGVKTLFGVITENQAVEILQQQILKQEKKEDLKHITLNIAGETIKFTAQNLKKQSEFSKKWIELEKRGVDLKRYWAVRKGWSLLLETGDEKIKEKIQNILIGQIEDQQYLNGKWYFYFRKTKKAKEFILTI